MLETPPGPTAYPFVGNALDIRDEIPIRALGNLADKYGPIYKLSFGPRQMIVVSNTRLVEEACDEKRFHKVPARALQRNSPGPYGLFVSPSEDHPDWQQAHRILMPAFGPFSISDTFDEMHDIAAQLVLKWARKGPEYRIPATSDFTRLTLDTIALCAMDYRFNSFYDDNMHPFVEAMTNTLSAANGPSSVFEIIQNLGGGKVKFVQENRRYMQKVAQELVQRRRNHPSDKKDLLNAMLNGKDPKTGEGMRDELIAANMTTFLIAGHETTSGLLSFTFYHLLKSPAAYQAAQSEVDRVLGKAKAKPEHLKQLPYINAVLREALRLNPTAPAFSRKLRDEIQEEPVSYGGYQIDKQASILCLTSKSQRDPEVYGEDADEFKPERMLDGNFAELPKSAWKPFGTGQRACIGRPFAWQEAVLAVALVLQNFNLKMDDANYELRIKQTLTIKPQDFYIRAELREGVDATKLQCAISADSSTHAADMASNAEHSPVHKPEQPKDMVVAYGSNTGTCQTLAQRLASDASHFGYTAKVVDLDSATLLLQNETTIAIITASYEGQPPDNAAHFVHFLETTAMECNLEGLRYAVFGCGHSDWTSTFQRIPTLVDNILGEKGGHRIVTRGSANAAEGDIFSDFDTWADGNFWPGLNTIAQKDGESRVPSITTDEKRNRDAGLDIEIGPSNRVSARRADVSQAIVLSSQFLVSPGEPEKRHMEIQLPSDASYEPGDYLAVLPMNSTQSVQGIMARYHIPWDSTITIKASGATTLPTSTPLSVFDLLKGYVELSQPATKKDLRILATHTSSTDPTTKIALENISSDPSLYESKILRSRTSILTLLTLHPSISLPFATLLSLLPPMRLRHYSISSSPLYMADPTRCSITYAVVNHVAHQHRQHPTNETDRTSAEGRGEEEEKSGAIQGVATSYLASLSPGDSIHVAVKSTNKTFRLPLKMDTTPLIMFCAGTGLAPFRGFVQHRAAQRAANPSLGLAPALLFVGCRGEGSDRLYAEEVDEWVKEGVVDVRYAFSTEPSQPLSKGCRYIGERMRMDKEDVFKLWDQGAKVFVCGSPGVAKAVGEVGREIVRERREREGRAVSEEELREWWEGMRKGERFVSDVFA